jgi:UMF1 family MFS transporter
VLDDRLGARPVVAGAIGLALAAVAIIAFVPAGAPGGGLFASAEERFYLAAGALIGIAAGPMQAASRSLVARLAPEAERGAAFGLLAFSGRATAFLGPLLVGITTEVAGTQRAGLLPIAALFALGLVLLLRVPAGLNGGSAAPR